MLWLAAYLMGLPPTGLYILSWMHGLTPGIFQRVRIKRKSGAILLDNQQQVAQRVPE